MSSTVPSATRSHNETGVRVGGVCALSDSCISVISVAKVMCSISHGDSVKAFRLCALYLIYAIVYLLYWCYFNMVGMRLIFLRAADTVPLLIYLVLLHVKDFALILNPSFTMAKILCLLPKTKLNRIMILIRKNLIVLFNFFFYLFNIG